jgi:hypothetical protein
MSCAHIYPFTLKIIYMIVSNKHPGFAKEGWLFIGIRSDIFLHHRLVW